MRVPAGYTALAYGQTSISVSRRGNSGNMRLSVGYCMCTVLSLCWKMPEDKNGRQVYRCCTAASYCKLLDWFDCGWLNPAEPWPRFNLCFLRLPATRRDDDSKLNHARRGGHIQPPAASPATMQGRIVQLRCWVYLVLVWTFPQLFAPCQPFWFESLCGTWPHGLRVMRSYHVQSKQLFLRGAGRCRQRRNSANMTLRFGTLKARQFCLGGRAQFQAHLSNAKIRKHV